MPQALVDTSTPIGKRAVPPINASLGVNPDWQKQTETPLDIPSYSGAQQIVQMTLMFSLWARIESFLYGECGVDPLPGTKEENRNIGILLESETSILCLLCLLNNEAYSASGLVDAMIGQHATTDQRGNARKRLVNRTLPVIAGRYGLLQYQQRCHGNVMEYAITRSLRLASFAERHLVTGVQQIIGGEFTCANTHGGDE